jgi:hypothetical protein
MASCKSIDSWRSGCKGGALYVARQEKNSQGALTKKSQSPAVAAVGGVSPREEREAGGQRPDRDNGGRAKFLPGAPIIRPAPPPGSGNINAHRDCEESNHEDTKNSKATKTSQKEFVIFASIRDLRG